MSADVTSGVTADPAPDLASAPGPSTAGTVTVRFFAAAEEAAGVEQELAEVAAGAVLADVLAAATVRHPDLGPALQVCSYLVDAVSARPGTPVPAGAVIDVLPPFAGG